MATVVTLDRDGVTLRLDHYELAWLLSRTRYSAESQRQSQLVRTLSTSLKLLEGA